MWLKLLVRGELQVTAASSGTGGTPQFFRVWDVSMETYGEQAVDLLPGRLSG